MDRKIYLFASLTLGLFVASCQNGLEEVLEPSEVQGRLASTRAEEGTNEVGDGEEPLISSTIDLDINGYSIISGSNTQSYTITGNNLNSYYYCWNYNRNVLQVTDSTTTTITFRLVNSNSTANTSISVTAYRKSDNLEVDAAYRDIGCNGPCANTSNIRIVRASDGLEVYPSNPSVGLRPYTYYYAYFSNSMASSMTLDWDLDYAFLDYSAGYYAYFHTNDIGWTTVTVYGKMADSSVYKFMLSRIIYEGYDTSNGNKDENGEVSDEQKGDE